MVMFVAALSAGVALLMIQSFFYFLIANISCFTFFPHQSRRPEITKMKRNQLCGAWDTRSLDFMTQEVSLCTTLPICWIFFFSSLI